MAQKPASDPNVYGIQTIFTKYSTKIDTLDSFINTAAPLRSLGWPVATSESLKHLEEHRDNTHATGQWTEPSQGDHDVVVMAIQTQFEAGVELLRGAKTLQIDLASTELGYSAVIRMDGKLIPVAAQFYAAAAAPGEGKGEEEVNSIGREASAVRDLLLCRLGTANIPLPLYNTYVYVAHQLNNTKFGARVHSKIRGYWEDHVRIVHLSDFSNNCADWLLKHVERESSVARD